MRGRGPWCLRRGGRITAPRLRRAVGRRLGGGTPDEIQPRGRQRPRHAALSGFWPRFRHHPGTQYANRAGPCVLFHRGRRGAKHARLLGAHYAARERSDWACLRWARVLRHRARCEPGGVPGCRDPATARWEPHLSTVRPAARARLRRLRPCAAPRRASQRRHGLERSRCRTGSAGHDGRSRPTAPGHARTRGRFRVREPLWRQCEQRNHGATEHCRRHFH